MFNLLTLFTAFSPPHLRWSWNQLLPKLGYPWPSLTVEDYIVRFNGSTTMEQFESYQDTLRSMFDIRPKHVFYFSHFKGLAIEAPENLIHRIKNRTQTKFMITKAGFLHEDFISSEEPEPSENDNVYAVAGTSSDNSTDTTFDPWKTQADAQWNLARISHQTASQESEYIYHRTAGAGTLVYVVDTGINKHHRDWGRPVEFGKDFTKPLGEQDVESGDSLGHGTFMAGIIGSKHYGVAKDCGIVDVKISKKPHRAAVANVIAGIAFAIDDAKQRGYLGKAVLNLSFGLSNSYEKSKELNDMIEQALKSGIFVSCSAGNAWIDATGRSPASSPACCTGGAIDRNNYHHFNYGAAIDIFAPGVGVESITSSSDSSTRISSGTSIAAAHVAGLGAYILGLDDAPPPHEMCAHMKNLATRNQVKAWKKVPISSPATPSEKPNIQKVEIFESQNLIAFNGNPFGRESN